MLLLLLLLLYNTANTGLGLGPRGLWQSLEAVGTGGGVSAPTTGVEVWDTSCFIHGIYKWHWMVTLGLDQAELPSPSRPKPCGIL